MEGTQVHLGTGLSDGVGRHDSGGLVLDHLVAGVHLGRTDEELLANLVGEVCALDPVGDVVDDLLGDLELERCDHVHELGLGLGLHVGVGVLLLGYLGLGGSLGLLRHDRLGGGAGLGGLAGTDLVDDLLGDRLVESFLDESVDSCGGDVSEAAVAVLLHDGGRDLVGDAPLH